MPCFSLQNLANAPSFFLFPLPNFWMKLTRGWLLILCATSRLRLAPYPESPFIYINESFHCVVPPWKFLAKKLPKSLTASNEIRLSRLHISSYNFFKHTIKSAVKIQSTLLFLKFSLTPKLGEIWRKTCEKSQNFWRLQLWRLLAASFCEIRSFKKYHLKQLEKKSPMHPSYTRKIYFYRSKKLISSQQTVFLRWSDQRF